MLREWEATHAVGISGKLMKLGRPNAFTVMKNDKPIVIDTVRAEPSMFRNGCIALLGVDAITALGIDLNHHIDSLEHVDVKYRPSNEVCERAKEKALAKYPAYKQLERIIIIKNTYLSERICADYLKAHPNEYAQEIIDPKSIQIAPDVPAEIRAKILALLHQYEQVFARRTNMLPEEMKDVEPHTGVI